ncbi:sugar phosphate isomerase/epimerase [Vibrio kyushuensis]|uniref:sugar phosphate isomerase/epimerase family protein n=1 Tax=Vibrio kyushuensis TaxID=2910249 RepID=UPI003D0D2B23
MIKSGICSVTFRAKTVEEVVELTSKAGLKGIEWGADTHVPVGDLKNAERVGQLTRDAGLSVASYGSYLFTYDKAGDAPGDCKELVETAAALGAPVIRIWAGAFDLEKTPEYFNLVVQHSQRLADIAQDAGIRIAYEFHRYTFTETLDGTLKLLDAVDHPNIYTYWQPQFGASLDEHLQQIDALKEKLIHLHVFHWDNPPEFTQYPLADGESYWPTCFSAADEDDTERFAMLEFVRNGDPEQFFADAATLKKWLES